MRGGRRTIFAVEIVAAVLLNGCEAVNRADRAEVPWRLAIPIEAPVKSVVPLPIEERSEVIELEEVWAVGGNAAGRDYLFGSISYLDVDADGRVYVLDSQNDRVQVLDSGGRYRSTIAGVQGSGPGGLADAARITVVNDLVVLLSRRGYALSVWTREGEFVAERALELPRPLFPVAGLEEGAIITHRRSRRLEDGRVEYVLAKFSLEGKELVTYTRVVANEGVLIRRPGMMMSAGPPPARPVVTATVAGDVYVTPGDEYQVVAFDTTGSVRWALRGLGERMPFDETDIDLALDQAREYVPDAVKSEIRWPKTHAALSLIEGREKRSFPPIHIDGHGHLYVFPFVRERERQITQGRYPVDVYSRDGEPLFSGLIEGRDWVVARGDYVYGMKVNEESQEDMVVKYRLVEPW
jgi:hypothetical protein